jgi:hypothetical protein
MALRGITDTRLRGRHGDGEFPQTVWLKRFARVDFFYSPFPFRLPANRQRDVSGLTHGL